MLDVSSNLVRVGVFYDGNYFLHVSNYYNYQHPRASRISIRGMHEFIRHQIAKEEGIDARLVQVVDAHYFRGRISAYEAREMNRLFSERQFEDILMHEGVTTHYLPLRRKLGRREEKGIDVWLALECYEQTILKKYNHVCLLISDGDYVPLIRKLNTTGTKVMLLSWDLEFVDENGNTRETRTAQDLLEEASYPVHMHEIIENRLGTKDPLINNLFVPKDTFKETSYTRRETTDADGESENGEGGEFFDMPEEGTLETSYVFDVKKGFGFIEYPPNNLFFHASDLVDTDFNDLVKGDQVEFTVSYNERGPCAKNVRRLVTEHV